MDHRTFLDRQPPDSRPPTSGATTTPGQRRVELVWEDPVTGQRLSVALDATEAFVQRLRADGFQLEGAPMHGDPRPDDPKRGGPAGGGSGSGGSGGGGSGGGGTGSTAAA